MKRGVSELGPIVNTDVLVADIEDRLKFHAQLVITECCVTSRTSVLTYILQDRRIAYPIFSVSRSNIYQNEPHKYKSLYRYLPLQRADKNKFLQKGPDCLGSVPRFF